MPVEEDFEALIGESLVTEQVPLLKRPSQRARRAHPVMSTKVEVLQSDVGGELIDGEEQEQKDGQDADEFVVEAQELDAWKFGQVTFSFFLLTFSLSMLIPVLPSVLLNILNGNASKAAYVSGILGVATLPVELGILPYLGALSDRVGRKPILILGLIGFAMEMGLLAVFRNLPIYVLTRYLSSLSSAFPTTASACVADLVVGTGKEPVYFGILGFVTGLSFATGPLIGGLLVGRYGEQAALFTAVVVSAMNAFFVQFILPETLKMRQTKAVSFEVLNFTKLFAKTRYLSALVVTLFFVNFTNCWHNIAYLYFYEKLGWDASNIGTFISIAGVVSMITQGFGTRYALKLMGEYPVLVVGFLSELGYMSILTFGVKTWHMYASLVVGSFGWIAMPTLRAIIARQVPTSQQGTLQGSLSAMNTVQSSLGSLFMSISFGYFVSKKGSSLYMPNAPFMFILFNMVLATYFVVRSERIRKEESSDEILK